MSQPVFSFPYYDVTLRQGEDFVLHFVHKDDNGNAWGLTGASAEMQIRKSPLVERMSAWVKGSAVTGSAGGTGSKEFYATGGTAVSGGGFTLNVASNGTTPQVGGVFLRIPHSVTQYVPSGMNFYDIEITTAGSTSERRVARMGEFFVEPQVTR